ncbi:ABC transporter permease subunit [Ectobacillus ponti]|uniref:ABC transporter permease subunit n=1 Tax=Ectobacillus ponti TaxID=2961894 RepID=A0AA41XF80_9BACI|nr:ABC transporter permease subunit [Ectobacillus ponti]MCP8971011.1 ABC transporter permease subunit [Ectobacillus ponti]
MMYVWKEWKEQTRGKGLWLAVLLLSAVSAAVFLQARGLPPEQGFAMLLLSLYDMAVYLLPLLCLFLASFSVMAEKESRSVLILLTKNETTASFLLKKSIAIHTVTIGIILALYMLFSFICKLSFSFSAGQFLSFLMGLGVLMLIFNQLGILVGYYSTSKMQAIGWNLFIWFLLLFLGDMVYLYLLPYVTYENVKIFAVFYFLNPFHAVQFYLETALGVFSLEHTSRLLGKFLFLSPQLVFPAAAVLWVAAAYALACIVRKRRVIHD